VGQLQTGITDAQISGCGAASGVGKTRANVVARSAKVRASVVRIVKKIEDMSYWGCVGLEILGECIGMFAPLCRRQANKPAFE
jgi:hypothetical protein